MSVSLESIDTGNRRRDYAAIIAMACTFGATFGLTTPLVSMVMTQWGISDFVIGANAAMPGLAALLLGASFSRLMNWLGLRPLLFICLSVVVVSCVAFPAFPNVGAWFVLRFAVGAAGMGLFIISEYWINAVATPQNRGRLIAIYTTAVAAGWIVGALLLSGLGTQGWPPFIAGAVLISLAFVPVVIVPVSAPPMEEQGRASIALILRRAPVACAAALISGILYLGGASLLPVYAVAVGMNEAETARCIVWLAVGQLALPFVTGALMDRFPDHHVIVGMAFLGTTLFWIFPWVFGLPVAGPLMLIVLGGLTMGLYAVALTVLGHQFRGAQLAVAMVGVSIMFSVGEMAGPPAMGAAMEIDPAGFSITIAVIMTGFLIMTLIRPGKP